MDQSTRQYIIDRVVRRPVAPAMSDCWEWTLAVADNGYAHWARRDALRGFLVHRVAYEAFVGPIPEGLHIDHLCVNRRCMNPDHLEPVTQRENTRRAFARTGPGYALFQRASDDRWVASVSITADGTRKRRAFYGRTAEEASAKADAWLGDRF